MTKVFVNVIHQLLIITMEFVLAVAQLQHIQMIPVNLATIVMITASLVS